MSRRARDALILAGKSDAWPSGMPGRRPCFGLVFLVLGVGLQGCTWFSDPVIVVRNVGAAEIHDVALEVGGGVIAVESISAGKKIRASPEVTMDSSLRITYVENGGKVACDGDVYFTNNLYVKVEADVGGGVCRIREVGGTSSNRDEGQADIAGACKLRGNQAGAETCMTTMSALLSQPGRFDGRLVSFYARVDQINGAMLFFPSPDALEARDSFSSLVAYPQSSPAAFQKHSSVGDGGQLMRVTGRFHWNRDGAVRPQIDPLDVDRMGLMEGVDLGP
ncbi:hypothetical protein [Stenotrophomonas sp. PFBMAA-4]|uniref:hypothetical protein n=1 Tax=Stenotrophomonas sp. PFBMAA-4 TaxID=3043301 RepID=UPI0024B619F1|nr:hypothetical protein [Stenotrophomonas sp. PFBMAA-4]MDI9272377.1 hypothetical protein [Stenotrophomonas sp. PFBMAA-4]